MSSLPRGTERWKTAASTSVRFRPVRQYPAGGREESEGSEGRRRRPRWVGGCRRRAGDEKRFDEKMERGRGGETSGTVSRVARGGRRWRSRERTRRRRRICRTRATRSECCPARKNGYSFSNVPDAHARFPAKRIAGVRRDRRVEGSGVERRRKREWQEGENEVS